MCITCQVLLTQIIRLSLFLIMDFGHQLMLMLLFQGQVSNYQTLMSEIVALSVDVKHPLHGFSTRD